MNSFIQEDGMGNMFDEKGDPFVEMKMEVDEVNYPLNDVTNFDQYSDLKLPEKMHTIRKKCPKRSPFLQEKKSEQQKDEQKVQKRGYGEVFLLVNEKRMSIRGAAADIKVPSSTGYNWHKKDWKAWSSMRILRRVEPGVL